MLDQQWLIGSAEDCDLLIDAPTVSAHHAHLMRVGKSYFLEDSGSTNGTYYQGQRLTDRTPVDPSGSITLGRSLVLPWPDGAAAKHIVVIGRDADNDFCIDHPSVSHLHARFLVGHNQTGVIEDLDSTNGVAIDLRGVRHRIRKAVAVQPEQTVYFGSIPVAVAALIEAAQGKTARPRPMLQSERPPSTSTASRLSTAGTTAGSPPLPEAYRPAGPPRAIWFLAGAILAAGIFAVLSLMGEPLKQKRTDEPARPVELPAEPR